MSNIVASEKETRQPNHSDHNTKQYSDSVLEGFELMKNKCLSCHGSAQTKENRTAPPMIAIKRHYIDDNTNIDDFIHNISNFVMKPTQSKSKMPGAITRFGLMPYLNFDQEELKLIATAIYTMSLDKPSWFEKHFEHEHGITQQKKLNESKAIDNGTGIYQYNSISVK